MAEILLNNGLDSETTSKVCCLEYMCRYSLIVYCFRMGQPHCMLLPLGVTLISANGLWPI